MAEVKVHVHNERVMEEVLQGMQRRAQNLIPVWEKFGGVLARHNRLMFATAGAAGGMPWKPLSPAYAAWKLARVGARPILVFSDEMRQTLVGRPMGIEIYLPRSATYGSDDEKIGFHQFGTENMPARPPLVVTDLVNAELARLTADHIVGDEPGVPGA